MASALLIPKNQFVDEIETFFAKTKWSAREFLSWVKSYPAPPAAFFHRFSQMLAGCLDLDKMYFLRFQFDPTKNQLQLLQELHLSELHAPHEVKNKGAYCRRWLTTSLLLDISRTKQNAIAGIQRSEFVGTSKEYLCFSMAHRKELDPQRYEALTIGLRVDDKLAKRIPLLNDLSISKKVVGDACEYCSVFDCKERAAPPIAIEKQRAEEEISRAIAQLQGQA